MNESPPRPRRSPAVVLLDAVLGLVTVVQTGHVPGVGRAARRVVDRTRVVWLAVGALAAAGGTALLVSALIRPPASLADLPPAPAAGPAASTGASSPGTTPSAPAATSAKPAPDPSPAGRLPASTPATGSSSAAGTPRLAARYAVDGDGGGLLVYRATVTITSTGPRTGWTLTLTLPRPTLQIAAVSGATAQQDGSTWTFTPVDATRRLSAGSPVEVAFEVRGATLVDAAPTGCAVDGQRCAGLPG